MRTEAGTIVVVQEERFRLVSRDGRSHLFVISHTADIEPQDLIELSHRQEMVTVGYEPSDALVAGVARYVRWAPSKETGRQ